MAYKHFKSAGYPKPLRLNGLAVLDELALDTATDYILRLSLNITSVPSRSLKFFACQ
jgi:hypothetical protein